MPSGSDQINFTDPESRIMQRSGAFVQAFNAQAAVDADSHIVVEALLTNQSADAPPLQPLTQQTTLNTGRVPERFLADAGYCSGDRMRRRLAAVAGERLYLQRQASVEPVFGTTRSARGPQQFLHRGLENDHHLWRFDLTVHNLMKTIRHLRAAITPGTARRAPRGANPAPTAANPA